MKFARLVIVYSLLFLCHVVCVATWYGKDVAHLAAFKDPVVDLYIQLPLQHNPPLAGYGYSDGGCQRAHQALANEVVTIVERKGNLVKIACDTVAYGHDENTGKPLNTFWVHKKHLIFFKHLAPELLYAFPAPQGATDTTLVLRLPWKQYSLGTRFVHALEHDTEAVYGALLVTSQHPHAIKVLQIPRSLSRLELPLTPQQQRAHFVQLAYNVIDYAQQSTTGSVIPYVWGGSSFVHTYEDAFWLRNNIIKRHVPHMPYTGYDCSEFILRLAQACGIPYVAKTTTMIAQMLKPLKRGEQLENGDIIWFPGHVIIVSDVAHHEMIEARGYKGGYGKVHCIKLAECFRGIATYKQLLQAYYKKRPLTRIKKDGSVENVIKEFKLLKLL